MDIPPDLVKLETRAYSALRALGDLPGDWPKSPGDWTPEQREDWERRWADFRTSAIEVQQAISAHAEATEVSRYAVEAAVKQQARHGS